MIDVEELDYDTDLAEVDLLLLEELRSIDVFILSEDRRTYLIQFYDMSERLKRWFQSKQIHYDLVSPIMEGAGNNHELEVFISRTKPNVFYEINWATGDQTHTSMLSLIHSIKWFTHLLLLKLKEFLLNTPNYEFKLNLGGLVFDSKTEYLIPYETKCEVLCFEIKAQLCIQTETGLMLSTQDRSIITEYFILENMDNALFIAEYSTNLRNKTNDNLKVLSNSYISLNEAIDSIAHLRIDQQLSQQFIDESIANLLLEHNPAFRRDLKRFIDLLDQMQKI